MSAAIFAALCAKTRTDKDSHVQDGYTEHGEWFKIDEKEACQRVERWRRWMRQEPYDAIGDMKSDFRRRVDYCEKHMEYLQKEDDANERWKTFMTPFCMTDWENEALVIGLLIVFAITRI